ncbi:hypothetical protein L208DRAFT_1433648 [Tricholoma matsutake]|nr:hypothetical protein L208DRAFT_1433648 [Tricholoma matsutake 945]
MPHKVCYQFQASGTCTYGVACKFSHATETNSIPRASQALQRLDRTRTTKSIYLEEFFANYPGFEYDSSQPATSEFRRLRKMFRWSTERHNEAKKAFHVALVKEFNWIYGTNEHDIQSWRILFRVLGIAPIPETRAECHKVMSATHVNLVDLVNTSETITLFESESALAEYTNRTKKYFPLGERRAGGFLQYLLRHIKNPDAQRGTKARRRRRRR